MMIEITAAAAERIRAALAAATGEGLSLRVAARRSDDGEIEYGMGLDERRDQDQEVATRAGITLLVSPPSLEPLAGTVIDYVEIEPGDLRFVFYRAGGLEPGGDAAPPATGSGD
jgi:iron-sulfur cluster assembly protein